MKRLVVENSHVESAEGKTKVDRVFILLGVLIAILALNCIQMGTLGSDSKFDSNGSFTESFTGIGLLPYFLNSFNVQAVVALSIVVNSIIGIGAIGIIIHKMEPNLSALVVMIITIGMTICNTVGFYSVVTDASGQEMNAYMEYNDMESISIQEKQVSLVDLEALKTSLNESTVNSLNAQDTNNLFLIQEKGGDMSAYAVPGSVTVESDIVRLGDIADDDKLKMKMFFNDKDD